MGSSAGLEATLRAALHSNIDTAAGILRVITEAACSFRADASGSWHTTYVLLNSQFTLSKSSETVYRQACSAVSSNGDVNMLSASEMGWMNILKRGKKKKKLIQ